MNSFILAVIIQIIFTIYFSITHWIPLFPFNHIRKEGIFKYERITVVIHNILQILSITSFFYQWRFGIWVGLMYWTVLFVGHILEWWTTYLLGWPKALIKTTNMASQKTIKLLPSIKNHPVPDTCHFFIGVLAFLVIISAYKAVLFY